MGSQINLARRGPNDDGDTPGMDDDEDPATVASNGFRKRPSQSQQRVAGDDPTVQLSRMPISFIRDSVMDSETVCDNRVEATRWREEALREDDRPPASLPAAVPERPPAARPLGSHDSAPQQPSAHSTMLISDLSSWFDPRTAVLVPVLIGVGGGIVFLLILLALYAGSP